MPLPVLPIAAAAGLGALLLAGKSEKPQASATSTQAQAATPAQQSTGGANGGAQAPSHAEPSTAPVPPPTDGDALGGLRGFGDAIGGAITGAVGSASGSIAGAVESGATFAEPVPTTATGTQTGQESAFSQPAPTSPVSGNAYWWQLADKMGLTTRDGSNEFAQSASTLGVVY